MAVLIKGMEMPESCAKCELFGEYGCPLIGAVGYALTEGRRNEDCPLIEVPPHGRLVDADALIVECQKDEAYGYLSAFEIDNAPTIIPADKGETE